jgi:hypothetical protein
MGDLEEKSRAIKRESARAKGKRFQREVVRLFAEKYGLVLGDDIRSSIGAETGMDILLTSVEARERIGFAIECKASESIGIVAALRQADANSRSPKGNLVPVVVFSSPQRSKLPYSKWICMPLETFLKRDKNGTDCVFALE